MGGCVGIQQRNENEIDSGGSSSNSRPGNESKKHPSSYCIKTFCPTNTPT
jgi:hypothetical protein